MNDQISDPNKTIMIFNILKINIKESDKNLKYFFMFHRKFLCAYTFHICIIQLYIHSLPQSFIPT